MTQTNQRAGFGLWGHDRPTDAVEAQSVEEAAVREAPEIAAWMTPLERPLIVDAMTEIAAPTPPPATAPSAIVAPAEARFTRSSPDLLAELARAMQAAAEEERLRTVESLRAEARARVQQLHARAAEEGELLQKRGDEEIAAEITRLREETERRIAARKADLERRLENHAALTEREIERVQASVAAFEREMNAFFEKLTAEVHPARIMQLAGQMPEPPGFADLSGSLSAVAAPPLTVAERPDKPAPAAAAESPAEVWPADPRPAARALTPDLAVAEREALVEAVTEQVIVLGLTSVASIVSFKRHLGRLPGVSAVGVSSGPDGEFIFQVSHDPAVALRELVPTLPGFSARVTEHGDGILRVAGRDPLTVERGEAERS